MGKRLFLLLFSAFMGIFICPEFLVATDSVPLNQPEFNAVKTVEKKKEPKIEPAPVITYSYASVNTVKPVPVPVIPRNNISIAGRTLEVVQVGDTTVDAGNHVNRYGGSFLYGHNTGAVFGILYNVGVGSTFSVTIDGITTNYRVSEIVIYEKNTGNGRLEKNGKGNYMYSVASALNKDTGAQHSISLMTCYGTSYGNGDASHRWVVFADKI